MVGTVGFDATDFSAAWRGQRVELVTFTAHVSPPKLPEDPPLFPLKSSKRDSGAAGWVAGSVWGKLVEIPR